MARKTKEELEQIKNEYHVKDLFSWSKLNTFKRDAYEYYLKYIQKIPEDRKDSVYAVLGSVVHNCIENMYEEGWNNQDMIDFYNEQSEVFNLSGYKFDRCDEEKNKKIESKYHACNQHFLNHYQKEMEKRILIEEFITIMIGKYLFQGYIDMIQFDPKEKKIRIIDFKTSSIYKGEKLENEKGQLLLYVIGMIQKGYHLDDIEAGWTFTKYVKANYKQKNGKMNTKIIERNMIGDKLKSVIIMFLKAEGFSPADIDHYVTDMLMSNSLDMLPEQVKNQIQIEDCFVSIDLNNEDLMEFQNDVIETINKITGKEELYRQSNDENIWYQEVNDKHSYFMANLSGYSRKYHKPYDDYLKNYEQRCQDDIEQDTELADLLSELGL